MGFRHEDSLLKVMEEEEINEDNDDPDETKIKTYKESIVILNKGK
jgi:hypothetical protein